MTLTPAYGREYKSKKEVEADFAANKDFVVADMSSGRAGSYTNRADLINEKIGSVTIRYSNQRKVCIVKVK